MKSIGLFDLLWSRQRGSHFDLLKINLNIVTWNKFLYHIICFQEIFRNIKRKKARALQIPSRIIILLQMSKQLIFLA